MHDSCGVDILLCTRNHFRNLRPHDGSYDSSVDIWSLGITLYVAWCAAAPVDDTEWFSAELPSAYEFPFDEEFGAPRQAFKCSDAFDGWQAGVLAVAAVQCCGRLAFPA